MPHDLVETPAPIADGGGSSRVRGSNKWTTKVRLCLLAILTLPLIFFAGTTPFERAVFVNEVTSLGGPILIGVTLGALFGFIYWSSSTFKRVTLGTIATLYLLVAAVYLLSLGVLVTSGPTDIMNEYAIWQREFLKEYVSRPAAAWISFLVFAVIWVVILGSALVLVRDLILPLLNQAYTSTRSFLARERVPRSVHFVAPHPIPLDLRLPGPADSEVSSPLPASTSNSVGQSTAGVQQTEEIARKYNMLIRYSEKARQAAALITSAPEDLQTRFKREAVQSPARVLEIGEMILAEQERRARPFVSEKLNKLYMELSTQHGAMTQARFKEVVDFLGEDLDAELLRQQLIKEMNDTSPSAQESGAPTFVVFFALLAVIAAVIIFTSR